LLERNIKINVDKKQLEELRREFNAVQKSYAHMAEMVAKEHLRMLNLQEKETEALQKHLGRMEARAQKEAQLDAQKFSNIQKNIKAAEELARVQMQRDAGLTGQTSSLNSILAMQGRLAALNAELLKVDVNSDAFVELKNKIFLANQELENVGASTRGSTRGVANMSIAMQNLNYVVRDSAYFTQSFAFGVLAIGNNLNPMIDSMMRANREAKAMNSTFGKEMLGFLKGPGGIVLGLSLAVTAFQALTFAMAKNKDKAKEAKDFLDEFIKAHESLETQLQKDIYKVERLSLQELNDTYDAAILKIAELNAARNKAFNQLQTAGLSKEATDFLLAIQKSMPQLTPDQQRLFDAIINPTENLAKNIKTVVSGGDINLMRALGVSDRELETVSSKLREFAKDAPQYFKTSLQVGQEEFRLTGQEAKKFAEQIDEILNPKQTKEKKIKEIYDTHTKGIDEILLKMSQGDLAELDPLNNIASASNEMLKIRSQFGRVRMEDEIEFAKERAFELEQYYSDWEDKDVAFAEIRKGLEREISEIRRRYNEEIYSQQLDAISELGSALESAFSKSGDTLLSKLGEALQIAMRIAKAIQTAENPETDSFSGSLGIFSSLLSIFSFFHDGGIIKAHNGRLLGHDEVPVIAKKGEMVLNENQQSNLWQMINRGEGGSSQPITINLNNVMDGKVIDSRVYRILPDVQRQLIREGYL